MIVAFTANAQNYEDVVYLKNGSVIRGIIIEQVPNQTLKIQTDGGSIFVYNFSDIEKMTKEMPFADIEDYISAKKASQLKSFNKPKGYFGLAELGIAPGFDYNRLRAGVTIINGYRVVPQFAIGLGVGCQYYISYGELTLPVFLHLRSDFLNKSTSPFIAFNIGYNLSVLGGFYGGLMIEPSAGIGFNVGNKNRMTVGLGLSIDNVQYYYSGYLISAWAHALNIKVGFSF